MATIWLLGQKPYPRDADRRSHWYRGMARWRQRNCRYRGGLMNSHKQDPGLCSPVEETLTVPDQDLLDSIVTFIMETAETDDLCPLLLLWDLVNSDELKDAPNV